MRANIVPHLLVFKGSYWTGALRFIGLNTSREDRDHQIRQYLKRYGRVENWIVQYPAHGDPADWVVLYRHSCRE